jgi:putative component of membrane protein insertase Oxa1/YidC/SpoIIIJ protein YidD
VRLAETNYKNGNGRRMRALNFGAVHLVDRPAVFVISVYQRWLSPRKGYCCAHRALHHGDSCSSAAKAIISSIGLIKGVPLIRQRFVACREAAVILQQMASETSTEDPDEDKVIRAVKKECACDKRNCGEFMTILCSNLPP